MVSVVFCERIVPTSESNTHARRPQLPPPGPRSPLRSVRTRSITSGCSITSARWTARHSCSVGRAWGSVRLADGPSAVASRARFLLAVAVLAVEGSSLIKAASGLMEAGSGLMEVGSGLMGVTSAWSGSALTSSLTAALTRVCMVRRCARLVGASSTSLRRYHGLRPVACARNVEWRHRIGTGRNRSDRIGS